MGYSIYVEFKNAETRDKALDFMTKHTIRFSRLVGGDIDYTSYFVIDDEICYSNDSSFFKLGFNYSTNICLLEHSYIHALCRWVAFYLDTMHTIKGAYYIYDGVEKFYIKDCKFHRFLSPSIASIFLRHKDRSVKMLILKGFFSFLYPLLRLDGKETKVRKALSDLTQCWSKRKK